MNATSIQEYINEVQRIYATGNATEHSYRAVLGTLFDNIADDVNSINEPKAVRVGRPDFVFLRNVGDEQITQGHCEAKDVGLDISPRAMRDANKAQHTLTGAVHINKGQYFADVPQIAWEFYIGGYQPAQKWLKDRKNRELTFDDIRHYQKIIKILSETDRIMKTIEMEF